MAASCIRFSIAASQRRQLGSCDLDKAIAFADGVPLAPATPLAPAMTALAPRATAGDDAVVAPMPGLVLGIKVKEGEKVQAGQVLLLMEAMKMENAIQAPFTGTVTPGGRAATQPYEIDPIAARGRPTHRAASA